MAGTAESDEERRRGVDLATVLILRLGMYQGKIPGDILGGIVRRFNDLDAEGQAAAQDLITHFLQSEVGQTPEEAQETFDRWFHPQS